MESDPHTGALAGTDGVPKEDQDPTDHLISGATAGILAGEYNGGMCF